MRDLHQGQEFSIRYRTLIVWLRNLCKIHYIVKSPDDLESTCDLKYNSIPQPFVLIICFTSNLSLTMYQMVPKTLMTKTSQLESKDYLLMDVNEPREREMSTKTIDKDNHYKLEKIIYQKPRKSLYQIQDKSSTKHSR